MLSPQSLGERRERHVLILGIKLPGKRAWDPVFDLQL